MQHEDSAITLAVLVRTGGQKSPQRLESIKSTWGGDLEEGALTLLEPDEDCKSKYGDNHWEGLTCLEAKSHVRLMNRTDFRWLLIVDDDTYVFANRLRDTLKGMDPDKPEAYGAPYCGDCGQDRKGFCGGGGYLLSRKSLLKMASHTQAPVSNEAGEAFVQQMMAEPNIGWCDVRFGCVAQDTGLKLVGVKGMYGNGIVNEQDTTDEEEEAKVIELNSQDPPLVFHKVRSDAHMQRVHQDYQKEKEADLAAGKKGAYSSDGSNGNTKWSFLQMTA